VPCLTRSNRRGTWPVCPVVWEGRRREVPPYPDPGWQAAVPDGAGEQLPRAHACRSANAGQFPEADTNVERFFPARTAAGKTPTHLSRARYAIPAHFQSDVSRCILTKLR